MAITQEMVQLGAAAQRLNAGSDRLNVLLSRIDEVLGQLMLGLDYVHPRPIAERSSTDADGMRVIEISYLAYLRQGGSYHLCVKLVKVLESKKAIATEQPGSVTPLLQAPRRVRHAAVDTLPDLVSGLASQVDEIVGKMEARCDLAQGLLDHLEGMLYEESRGTPPMGGNMGAAPAPGAQPGVHRAVDLHAQAPASGTRSAAPARGPRRRTRSLEER